MLSIPEDILQAALQTYMWAMSLENACSHEAVSESSNAYMQSHWVVAGHSLIP